MRVLVTGAGGFVGRNLIPQLTLRGHQVIAGLYSPADSSLFSRSMDSVVIDFREQRSIAAAIEKVQPEAVIHLAAQSNVQLSWEMPAQTYLINTVGTASLLEILRQKRTGIKVILVGSSEEYGESAKQQHHVTEEAHCLPRNPYATSKFAVSQMIHAFNRDLNIVYVRPFNHYGPYQTEKFVIGAFASQLARIELGIMNPVIHVGNLSSFREFTYISDVVDAYVKLLEQNVENGIYNICSEKPVEIRALLNQLIEQVDLPIQVQLDPEYLRPSDIPIFAGSAQKIRQAVGWEPKVTLEEGLRLTLEWWRNEIRNEEFS